MKNVQIIFSNKLLSAILQYDQQQMYLMELKKKERGHKFYYKLNKNLNGLNF